MVNLGTREAEYFLLAVLSIAVLISVYELRGFREQTAYSVLIVTLIMVISLIVILLKKFFRAAGIHVFKKTESTKEEFETVTDEREGSIAIPDMPKSGLEILWIAAYLLSMNVIGFFTSTFLYAAAYIMWKEDELAIGKRLLIATASSAIIVSFIYILFIYVLSAITIFRLGPLP